MVSSLSVNFRGSSGIYAAKSTYTTQIFHEEHSGEGVIFSVEVNDADSAYLEAKEKNLNIVLSLRSEEWGQCHFSIKDPNGVYVDIVQAIEPTKEYRSGYDSE